MDNLNMRRKRWNTIGFTIFIIYFFLVLGLMIVGRHYKKEFDIIQNILVGVCIVLIIAVTIYRISWILKNK